MKTKNPSSAEIDAFAMRLAKALTVSPLDMLSKRAALPSLETQIDVKQLARIRDEVAVVSWSRGEKAETRAVQLWIYQTFKETFGIDPIGE